MCKGSVDSWCLAKIVEVSRVQVIQLLSLLSCIFAYKPHWVVSVLVIVSTTVLMYVAWSFKKHS